jgi:hypothetical protein
MMDGQSHRAKLRQIIDNTGGQRYDPHGSDDPPRNPSGVHVIRPGTAIRRGRGGGVVGNRGRGALTAHRRLVMLHESRFLNELLTRCTSPITPGHVTNRPLDPAIDLNDPRSKYRSGRGSAQNSRDRYLANRSPARGHVTSVRSPAFGSTAQNVRARMVGTTVQMAMASVRLPQARQLALNGNGAPPSSAINHTQNKPPAAKPVSLARFAPALEDCERDRLLDPARFLAAIASTNDREIFNTMVPLESKQAPASNAAEVIADPSKRILKTFAELVQAIPKPVLPPKAIETVSSLSLLKKEKQEDSLKKDAQRLSQGLKSGKGGKLGPGNSKAEKHTPNKPEVDIPTPEKQKAERHRVQIPNVVNNTPEKYQEWLREERKLIRQVPTHEFVFPPPNSRSTPLYGDVDAYMDGVPSPGTLNFSPSSEDSPPVELANMIQEGNTREEKQPSSPTLKEATAVVGLGISARPASLPEPTVNVEPDLLMLGSEEVNGYGSGALVVQNPRVSGAATDLIDLEFDNIPQESLTPYLLEHVPAKNPEPKAEPVESSATSMEHPPYVDIGGIRYYREDQLARAIPPEAATDINATATPLASAGSVAMDRVITGSGYTIGVCHMGVHNGNLLGDRNLARRAQESSLPPTIHSAWADSPLRATGKRCIRAKSPVRVEQQSTPVTIPQRNVSLDSRPAAIGEQNHPGRSRKTASRDVPANSPSKSAQVEVCHVSRHVECPPSSTMPREANPWDTSSSFVSTDPRASQLAGSHRTEATTRDLTIAGSSSTTPGVETQDERIVRLINSRGSTGMTRLTLERPKAEISQARESKSSTDSSKESSRSQTSISRSRGNLVTSKWATGEAGTPSISNRQFSKPASLPYHVLSFRKSDTPILRSDGKITTKIIRTHAGPGFDLLKAEAEARKAASNSRETATVVPTAQFTNEQVNSVASAARFAARTVNSATLTTSAAAAAANLHITTTQSLNNLNATPGRNMPSEPRRRVVNPALALRRSHGLAVFEGDRSNNDGEIGSELEH